MKIILKHKYLSPSTEVSYLIFEFDWKFEFKEWQFVMLWWEVYWNNIKRAYSIATTNDLAKENKIGFVIKKASEFWMSKYLTQDIQVWESIDMTWPYWHLTNNFQQNNYLLISVGSGIAPIISHYVNLEKTNNYNKIVNIFGERYYRNIVPEFENIFNNKTNIQNLIYLSQEENIPQWYYKWYVQEWIEKAMDFINSSDIKVFICWKPEMVDSVTEILTNKWIEKDNIKAEKY